MGCGSGKGATINRNAISKQPSKNITITERSLSSKKIMMTTTQGNIKDFYELGKTIGKGISILRLIWTSHYR